jgi:hypothetical protein
MATFLAEYDPGRPRVTEDTFQYLQSYEANVSTAEIHTPLKIYAHFWRASILDSSKQLHISPRDQDWFLEDWWTPTEFVERLYVDFPTTACCTLEGDASDSRSSGMSGVVSFDDPDFRRYIGTSLICVVLNTVKVRGPQVEDSSSVSGYGYYQIVIGESAEVPGAYERLGVAISVSHMQDRIPHGFLGRKSPDTVITLV